ncbi:MAG: tetratricopeptide repeat protein [Rhodospirillum sp.]|nr:tetratricopeptide repeat protein [Rhodospirillum sp.]MCF8490097.1 tetratricopeptide repeat protein [Rhodospirillum sp.]MCF8502332.1 tetratricopeptide repeat protein [Rhodospirillum sp.]
MVGAPAHLDAAIAAVKTHAPGEAVNHLRAYLDLEPGEPQAWNLLAETLLALGRTAEALEVLDRALSLDPDNDGALFHRARALDAQDRPHEALRDQEALVQRHPNNGEVLHNLALLRRHAGDPVGSEAALRHLLTLSPERQNSRLALAHALLAREEWAEGFALYDARLALPGWHRSPLPAPHWDGSPLAGRSLLVTAEQGLGDGVQFLRYLLHIADAGRLVVECHPPLRRLVETIGAVDQVVDFTPEGLVPETDLRVALGSLPALVAQGDPLGATLPYLAVSPSLPSQPPTLAQDPGPGMTLGLVWRSSDRPELKRDPPPEILASLADIPGIHWTSLQWAAAPAPFPVDDGPISRVRDLMDTAQLIAGLDGVVTVDTVVAHLAGAMGKPTWILLGSRPDWRWGQGGQTTPWYPTARLFRRGLDPWERPLTALADSLRQAMAGP